MSVGKKEISDKENFITSELNPVFGRVYELDAVLPFDRTLTITVMDHDYLTADDVIGMHVALFMSILSITHTKISSLDSSTFK